MSEQNETSPTQSVEITDEKKKEKKFNFNLKKTALKAAITTVALFLLFSLGIRVYNKTYFESINERDYFSSEIVQLYEKYDRNSDGILDLNEFEPLGHRILSIKQTQIEKNEPAAGDEEFITLNSFYEPITSDLINNKTYSPFNSESLSPVKKWSKPNIAQENFACKNFFSFLPIEDFDSIKLGKVWHLIPRRSSIEGHLSSNRYDPPEPEPEQFTLFRILQMFHPRPFLATRFPPQGTSLILRARNDHYLDIAFRIHAEFQLNEPPNYPFWFTPGSFQGRIVISRNLSHIEYFHMYLPTDKRLNIDMEWLNGPEAPGNMEVDIGFVSRMEIISSSPSLKSNLFSADKSLIKPISNEMYQTLLNQIKWKEQIDLSECFSLLEKSFYPFKQITYYNFLDAFKEASRLNKLVHFILLWGALDDQSC